MPTNNRLHALDGVRAFALLLGIAFHAAMSFVPGLPPGVWAMVDNSPSAVLGDAAFVSHIFRMSLFFFVAGFFARMLREREGTRGFWSNRLKRIAVPLVAGWIFIFPLIAFVWTIGLKKVFATLPPQAPPPGMPEITLAFPLTHLWFLYYLLLIYAAVLAIRGLFVAADVRGRMRTMLDRIVLRLLRGYGANVILGVPLAACLLSLSFWVYWQGIPTPDRSLLPEITSFVGFASAFVFGWCVHRVRDTALTEMTRRCWGHLAIAIGASAICLWILHSQPPFTPVTPGVHRTVFTAAFVVALWSWVFAITGLTMRFWATANPVRRYVADASYWMYIAHLPVVAGLHVWVGQWSVHWSLKYPFVLIASLAVLLLSYHYLVRSTFIGQLLNGRKYPRSAESLPSAPAVVETSSAPAPAAELRNITKRYGAIPALTNVDLRIERGGLTAVLGPNGAGKSTAISLWLSLIEPDAGEAWVLGRPPTQIENRRRVGVMMQNVELPRELRVRELIALSASYYTDPLSIEETLELTHLTELADRPYAKLSGGQKRQVQFALAICGRPELLFLDEPTVGLDVHARETMWATIRSLLASGCTIVLTTHYLEEAEALADRVIVLANGQVIASGTVDEMRALVSRRHISCETQLAAEEVSAWPGVLAVTREISKLRITAIDAENVVRRLLASDTTLSALEVRQAGLNEAFTRLTQEAA